MCTTWYNITYCEACKAYIDSSLVGTVFCGRHDQKLPCKVEKAIGETAVPGPCDTCEPPPRIRRSQRLWLRSLEKPEESDSGEERCDNNDKNSDDENSDDDEDSEDKSSAVSDTDSGSGSEGEDSEDDDYMGDGGVKNSDDGYRSRE